MVEKTCWIVIRICLCYFLFCINIGNFIPSFLSASTEFIRQASLFHPIFKRRFCKTAGLCPFEKPTPEKRNLFFFPLPVSHLDVFIFPRDAAPRRQNKVFFSTLAGSWKTKTKTKTKTKGHCTSEAEKNFNSCRILKDKDKDKGTPHLGGKTSFFQLLQNLVSAAPVSNPGSDETEYLGNWIFSSTNTGLFSS